MKVSTLAEKIVVVEDVFDDRELALVDGEIGRLREHIQPTYQENDVTLYRAAVDKLYRDRKDSFVLQSLPAKLYAEPVQQACNAMNDLAYTLYAKQHRFTTALTEFRGDTRYRSHTDTGADIQWTQIFLSWIWYHNPHPERMTGGELVVEELDLTIEPRHNRLVLLPAYLWHRIEPAVYDTPGYYRTTLNGFLTWSPATATASGTTDGGVELALAAGTPTADMFIPEPKGKLETVRRVTAEAIVRIEETGEDVGEAVRQFRKADEAKAAGRNRQAVGSYVAAYRTVTSIEPG